MGSSQKPKKRASKKKPANRRKTGQFQKGKSGNPSGRPKVHQALKAQCRDLGPEMLETITQIARDVQGRAQDRLRAAEMILAYGYGRPVTQHEVRVEDVRKVDDDQLRALFYQAAQEEIEESNGHDDRAVH